MYTKVKKEKKQGLPKMKAFPRQVTRSQNTLPGFVVDSVCKAFVVNFE